MDQSELQPISNKEKIHRKKIFRNFFIFFLSIIFIAILIYLIIFIAGKNNAGENTITYNYTTNNNTFVINNTLVMGQEAITNLTNQIIEEIKKRLNETNFTSISDKGTLTGSLASTKGWTYTYDNLPTIISYSELNNNDSDVIYLIYKDGISIGTGQTINLPVGNYIYTLGSLGGINWNVNNLIDSHSLIISKNTGICNVLFNESSPITYSKTLKVFSDCTTSASIYKNGILLQTPIPNLGVGIHNFSVIRTDQTNYSNIYDEKTFIVNRGQLTGNLIISGDSWTIPSGTQVTIGFSETNLGDSDVNYIIYKNGISIGDGGIFNLSVGNYSFVAGSFGGVNWTANSSIDSQILIVY